MGQQHKIVDRACVGFTGSGQSKVLDALLRYTSQTTHKAGGLYSGTWTATQ